MSPRRGVPSREALAEAVARLYRAEQLSVREIARRLRVSRPRVRQLLAEVGADVPPRGAGRPRPARRQVDPPDLERQLRKLYTEERLTRAQIAAQLGMTEGLVRSRLAEYGIPTRTRGRWNREDRRDVRAADVRNLYARRGLTAEAVGQRLRVSPGIVLRAAHDHGLAVRPGAAAAAEAAVRLIAALYADPLVRDVLTRHRVPLARTSGPIWQRFPAPVALTDALVRDLYVDCGVSVAHIELLTGQPRATVSRRLRRAQVPMRPAGGRSPFLRRSQQRTDEGGGG